VLHRGPVVAKVAPGGRISVTTTPVKGAVPAFSSCTK
jgi:hypothetical protein